MMMAKNYSLTVVFFVVVGVVAAAENYMDYGTDEATSNDKAANLRELYRILVQRSADDTDALRGLGALAEHLQPRAAERSPSLRLRFGRSYTKYPVGLLSRLNDGASSAAALEEN